MRDIWEYKEIEYARNCDGCGVMTKIFAIKSIDELFNEYLCMKCIIAALNAHEEWDMVEEQRAMP